MKTSKRLLVGFLSTAMVLALAGGVALAGTKATTSTRNTLLQGDPYYWVKCEQERLGLCVFAGTDAEAGFRLQIAQERLEEAIQLMEQSRFAEASSALEQYRVQIQAMNQAMVSVRERVASGAATGSGASNGSSESGVVTRTGWLSPGKIVARVEQHTRAQLKILDRLCTQSRDQVREQARLALEECTRVCTCNQSGQSQSVSQGNQGSTAGQTNKAQGTSVNSGQQTQAQERTQTQQQNQAQEQQQNQTLEQNQTQQQNQTREQNQTQQQNQTREQNQQQQKKNQPPSEGPTDQPNHSK